MAEEMHSYAVEMGVVHNTFRREYEGLGGLIRSVDAGDTARAAIVVEHLEMISALLHAHHEGEDLYLWPKLVERAAPELASLVDRMADQHEAVAGGLSELGDRVRAWWPEAGADARDALADALERFILVLDQHLTDEEKYVVPLLERHISTEEWSETVAHSVGHVPQEQLPLIFGITMHDAPDEVVDGAIATMPPEVAPVMKQLSEQQYTAHYARLYGTSAA